MSGVIMALHVTGGTAPWGVSRTLAFSVPFLPPSAVV